MIACAFWPVKLSKVVGQSEKSSINFKMKISVLFERYGRSGDALWELPNELMWRGEQAKPSKGTRQTIIEGLSH